MYTPNTPHYLDDFAKDIFEHSIDAILLMQPDGVILRANPAACELLGRTEQEICELGRYGIVDHLDPRVYRAIKKRRETGSYRAEFNLLHRDGSKIPCEATSSIFTDKLGIEYYILIVRDVSERNEYERLLKLSEELLSKAFEANPHMMLISSAKDGEYVRVNKGFLDITGYSKKEILGAKAVDLGIWVNSKEREKLIETLLDYGYVLNREFQFRTKSGAIKTGILSSQLFTIENVKYILSVVTDVTEQRALEKSLQHMERINILGQMAASISHEIRNPMTTSRGFLQLMREKLSSPDLVEYVDVIISELDRANMIITNYLSLAKNKIFEKKYQNLNTILTNLLPLIEADAILNNISISTELTKLPDILLDESEIRQVVLNLIKNGIEAMQRPGSIEIKTYINEQKQVVLCIKDQGPGIAPQFLENIGTPFISTKPAGTGLGLTICRQIAERHNATLTAETGTEGTCFYLTFDTPDNNQ